MIKSILMVLSFALIVNYIKGQDYKNKVLNLETGEVKTYEMTPDSFPSTLSDHMIVDFISSQSNVELLTKIQGVWIYNNTIRHKGDTITSNVIMTFKEFSFKSDKRFFAISQNSGDTIQGNYEIDDKTKILKLTFDKPYDDLKGSDFGKYLPEDTKKSFIYTNLIFSLKMISNTDLIFVSTNPIGTHNGDSFNEIIFNDYKKK